MIASYKYNYIFIKPRKVGGTTVEAVLSQSCGPDDIIAPLGRSDEMARSAGGAVVCRNFATPELEQIWRDAVARCDFAELAKIQKKRRAISFWAHMPAAKIRQALDQAFWEKACKMTLVRHPYEIVVSKAYFQYNPKHGTFEDLLDQTIRKPNYATVPYFTIDGRPVVDEILRTETLQADLLRVGAKLGIPIPAELPRLKSKFRTDRRPAREILSDEQKEMVFNFCKADFELLGYER